MSNGRVYSESARARCKRLLSGKFSKLKSALNVNQKFAFWSREEFIESLLEINRLSCLLVSETRSQLMFSILPGSIVIFKGADGKEKWGENWRSTMKICVFKVDKITNFITSEKLINLDAYYKILNTIISLSAMESDVEITSEVTCLSSQAVNRSGTSNHRNQSTSSDIDSFILIKSRHDSSEGSCPASDGGNENEQDNNNDDDADDEDYQRQMSATIVFDELTSRQFEDVDLDSPSTSATSVPRYASQSSTSGHSNLCSICMDNKADIILPCMHLYCCECIESWDKTDNENHDRCPQCRGKMSLKDNWVFFSNSDRPSQLDLSEYFMEAVDMS